MKDWTIQDAQARFGELLETCLKHGPQMVTREGANAAVLVPVRDWKRLQDRVRPTLKDLLLSDGARGELNIPDRGRHKWRTHSNLS